MAPVVKRQYRSALRTAQAGETRRAIVSAAARLFIEDGYAATTIDAVAAEAGVSRKTVFTAVGGKVDLLKLAVDWAIVGDDEPVALADRAEMRALLARDEPAALLRGWALIQAEINSRVAALYRALEIAADVDHAAETLRQGLQAQRLDGARQIVSRLIELTRLSADLTVDEAVDIAWLATDPVLYDRMVRQRGWSLDRFGGWLAASLVKDLMPSGR